MKIRSKKQCECDILMSFLFMSLITFYTLLLLRIYFSSKGPVGILRRKTSRLKSFPAIIPKERR